MSAARVAQAVKPRRYELRTHDGNDIVARLDTLLGTARIEQPGSIELAEGGMFFSPNWAGDTEVSWDSQYPAYRFGEEQYLDQAGATHLAGDLVVACIPVGAWEPEVLIPYTGGFEPPAHKLHSEPRRAARALELAGWVVGSEFGAPFDAQARIQQRARDYARLEGVDDLFQKVLAALAPSDPVD